jgi:dienelactone hydrolase
LNLDRPPITFSAAGKNFEGTLFGQHRFNGKNSAILLLPDWRGQTTHYAMRRAQELAQATGRPVLLSDLFGTKYLPRGYSDDAEIWISQHLNDPVTLRHKLSSFVHEAGEAIGVSPDQMVIAGYCLGGALALEAARSGVSLAAAVSVHGIPSTKLPVHSLSRNTMILAIHGGSDSIIGSDHLRAFESEMTMARANWRLLVLDQARHGFTDEDQPEDGQYMRYDKVAHKKSTDAIAALCEEILP